MRKLAWFSFSFAAAIFLAQYFLPVRGLPLAAECAAAAGLAACAALRGNRRRAALLAAFGLAAGFLWDLGYDGLIFSHARALDGTQTAVTAVVADFPVDQDYGSYVDLRVDAGGPVPVKGRAYIYDDSARDLRPGDEIRFTASFSTADKVKERRITSYTSKGYFLFIRGVRELEVAASPGATLTNFHRYLAKAIRDRIRLTFPLGAEGFMLALLTGDRSLLDEDEAAVSHMERAGITHIVAVSGMHVAILAGFLMTVLGKRRWTVLATAPALFVFMAISGFSASVTRAVVMQLFLLTAPLFLRESDSLTSLSAALLLLLAVNPYAVAGAGLQMSFAATLGILVVTPRLGKRLARFAPEEGTAGRRIFLALSGSVSTTVGALALTAPLSAYYFGTVSLAAPVSNLLILWAVSPAFLLGALAVGLAFLWLPLGRLVGFYPAVMARFILLAAEVLAKPQLACVYLSDRAMAWALGLTYLACAVLALKRARLRAYIPVLCAGIVAVCGVLVLRDATDAARRGYSLTVMDVGQGQSLLVTSAGHTAVIDCGSSSGEDAGALAERHIRALGRDSLDALILTHYHADHANGVTRLLASLDIRTLLVPEPGDGGLEEEILAAAGRYGTQVVYITEETFLALGDAGVTLYPPLGDGDENERGLIMTVAQGGFETLITGDAPGELERLLLKRYDLPDIECLVVGHHGSRTSTTAALLDELRPETAVISVGADNSYGHPTPEVLARLEERHISVLRTDEDGDVSILSR